MNEQVIDMAGHEMVQTIVEYDADGNPILPREGDEVVKEVFVQAEETIN